MFKVESIEETPSLSPAKWKGKLADGRIFIINAHPTKTTVTISEEPSDDIEDAMNGKIHYTVYEKVEDIFDLERKLTLLSWRKQND